MIRKFLSTLILTGLMLAVSVKANDGMQATETNQLFECLVVEAAIQYKPEVHKETFHCIDDQGLTVELEGLSSDFEDDYRRSVSRIKAKLASTVTPQNTGNNLTANNQSASDLAQSNQAVISLANSLSSRELRLETRKLKRQLKNVARPKLKLDNYSRANNKITLNQNSVWTINEDWRDIEAAKEALKVTQLAAELSAEIGVKSAEASAAPEVESAYHDYEGTATVLVVHITANDFATAADPSDLGDSVFGTLGDSINLASQYAACSYGKKQFVPATGDNIIDGVVQLTIDMNVDGAENSAVRNAVTAAGNDLFGDISAQADHVIYAIPPNTSGSWIAYAYINHWLSVYNNNWATYVSGQMHEVGHNLEMGHSNEGGTEYADQSGMMGFSYSQDDGPIMCFNAAKSSKFGWYGDKETALDNESWSGKLIGLADYADAATDHHVLLKIRSVAANDDEKTLNLTFNRSAGVNSGTREGANRVMVVESESPTVYNPTSLLAKLTSGETYTYNNFWGDGKELSITVADIGVDADDVQYALISVDNGEVLPDFELTVSGGSGDGSYQAGTAVDIVADAPSSDQEFALWVIESGSATIASPESASTTIVTGAEDTTILATYRNVYELTVNNGSGDGIYGEGVEVDIAADSPPIGQEFKEWVVEAGSAEFASSTSAETTLTMGSEATTVTATYVNVYALTVVSGSGSGNYAENAEIEITAAAAPSLQEFDQWVIVSGTATIDSPTSATAVVTMGAEAATITATYRDMPVLTVNNGTGSGSYPAGSEVVIVANTPPAGQEFDRWLINSGSVTINSTTSASTTATTGSADATITATYRNIYSLTVNDGAGDGSYAEGTEVTIQADAAPSGQEFDRWVVDSGSVSIASLTSENTTLTMGAEAAVVSATYRNIYPLTVENGVGSGLYAAGIEVTILADEAPDGQEFDQWIVSSGAATITSASSANTTLITGAVNTTVTATYRDVYSLTVESGEGSGTFAAGIEVSIVADTAAAGQEFDQWVVSSGSATFASATSASTTLTTGAEDTLVTATYRDVFMLTVENGSGSGSYAEGATVSIAAGAAPAGQEFDQWIVSSGSAAIASPSSANTTVVTGSADASVRATYRDLPANESGGGGSNSIAALFVMLILVLMRINGSRSAITVSARHLKKLKKISLKR